MEIGLRILALVVDVGVALGTGQLVMLGLVHLTELSPFAGMMLLPVVLVMFFLWPVLVLGVPTGLWGWTPGKLVFRLRVAGPLGEPPGVLRALAREALKLLCVTCMIGAIFCLFQILHVGIVWYDQLCGTSVRYKPWVRLTKTQKEFRKALKSRR